jgi:creatinine amidohydrolase
MKQAIAVGVLFGVAAGLTGGQAPPARKGVALSELAWPEADAWLASPSTVVVIPLGAGALEQGPHMKLDSDERLARYLASRVMAASSVVVAPTLTYHFYPAYAEYPGSTTLGGASARDVTVDAVRSLSRAGARRFYVLNTSPSTLGPLSAAGKTLADAGILLGYTDPSYWTKGSSALKQTPLLAGHAEEAATSMMLFVDPAAVDMTRAAREYAPGRGNLTRQADGGGVVSKTGVLGDATLATAEKGRLLVDALVTGVLDDIDKVRAAPLPAPKPAAPPPPPPPPAAAPARPAPSEAKGPGGCTASDDRLIRLIGARFSSLWSQADADNLALMFTPDGDIRHPDGSIERGRNVIRENRVQLFMRREYNGSKHPLQLNDVRCVGGNVAIADGKWELRLFDEPQTSPGRGLGVTKTNAGWCTLVVVKGEGSWSIEAWRYTIDPPAGAPPPTLLAKPGYVGRGGQ